MRSSAVASHGWSRAVRRLDWSPTTGRDSRRFDARSRVVRRTSRPTMPAAISAGVVRRCEAVDGLAGAHHRDRVGDRHHFVEPVRDEDHGAAGVAQTLAAPPRAPSLRAATAPRSARRGRESSRRDTASSGSRRAAPRRRTGRRPCAIRSIDEARLAAPSFARPRCARVMSSCMPRVGSVPSTMFSATVSVGTSMKCWCTIPTPAAIASGVDQPVTSRPFTSTVPGVGRDEPAEHFHERGLAGAVLADERVDLAGRDLERRVAIRAHRSERLRDPAHG